MERRGGRKFAMKLQWKWTLLLMVSGLSLALLTAAEAGVSPP
jgi:hypothetical protein